MLLIKDNKYLLAGNKSGLISIWNLKNFRENEKNWPIHEGRTDCLNLSPCENFLYTIGNEKQKNIKILRMAYEDNGEAFDMFLIKRISISENQRIFQYSLNVSQDNQYFFASVSNATIKQWSVTDYKLVKDYVNLEKSN